MNWKGIFEKIKQAVEFLIKWKFKITIGKAFVFFVSAEIAINAGWSFLVRGDGDGVHEWIVGYGTIGPENVWVSLIVLLGFVAFLFIYDRSAIHKAVNRSNLTPEQTSAVQELYKALINEIHIIDSFTLCIVNRGGLSWYSNNDIPSQLPAAVQKTERVVIEKRVFIDESLFESLSEHLKCARELCSSFQLLVYALSSADDQDAMTGVYNITYDQDIKMSVDFVKSMMSEFEAVDNHPAYMDYAAIYAKVNAQGLELLNILKGLIGSK